MFGTKTCCCVTVAGVEIPPSRDHVTTMFPDVKKGLCAYFLARGWCLVHQWNHIFNVKISFYATAADYMCIGFQGCARNFN